MGSRGPGRCAGLAGASRTGPSGFGGRWSGTARAAADADLISIPLFTGVIGYITNWTGVLMLFRPVGFHGVRVPGLRVLFPLLPRKIRVLPLIRYDGRIGWQGIVPSRADKMASISVDKGLAKLGSISDFYRELEPDKIAEHLAAVAQNEIRDVVEQIMEQENPQLWHDLPPVIKEAVFARVRAQLPGIVRAITQEIGENVDQLIDAKLMVISYFRRNPELLNELFLIMGKKELRFMQNFGFYFGLPMGFVLFGILQVFPEWYVLPIGGVFIGWVANYIGIEMIFEPVQYKKWVPWHQGLMLKRQARGHPACTRAWSPTRSSPCRTSATSCSPARAATAPCSCSRTRCARPSTAPSGPARAAVRMAIGSAEYDNIRSSVATEATGFAPIAFNDAEFSRQQSSKIYSFISDQMSRMDSRRLRRDAPLGHQAGRVATVLPRRRSGTVRRTAAPRDLRSLNTACPTTCPTTCCTGSPTPRRPSRGVPVLSRRSTPTAPSCSAAPADARPRRAAGRPRGGPGCRGLGVAPRELVGRRDDRRRQLRRPPGRRGPAGDGDPAGGRDRPARRRVARARHAHPGRQRAAGVRLGPSARRRAARRCWTCSGAAPT